MNFARWFSYTRLLERQLIKERRRYERERAADLARWENQRHELEAARQRIENVVFLAHGVNAPHRHLSSVPRADTSTGNNPVIPRAVGPIGQFGLAARNATLAEREQQRLDAEARRDHSVEQLTDEAKERIRNAADEKGLLNKDTAA